jgi:hypothetical protein
MTSDVNEIIAITVLLRTEGYRPEGRLSWGCEKFAMRAVRRTDKSRGFLLRKRSRHGG